MKSRKLKPPITPTEAEAIRRDMPDELASLVSQPVTFRAAVPKAIQNVLAKPVARKKPRTKR